MKASKKGFVLYFDACDAVRALPPDQRGYLFTALCDYAEGLKETDCLPETALDTLPELQPEARMAFTFMAGSIRRDNVKWQEMRRQRREQALAHYHGGDVQKIDSTT